MTKEKRDKMDEKVNRQRGEKDSYLFYHLLESRGMGGMLMNRGDMYNGLS